MNFADTALKLAGQTALLLGWRPAEFWDATPAELRAVLHGLAAQDGAAGDHALLGALMEQFPDG